MSLPTTQQVLKEHILAKIKFLFPKLADKITQILCDGRSNADLLKLLTSECHLEQALDGVISQLDEKDKESYGDLLFYAVVSIEQELSAQVTGMLLELPPTQVLKLISDQKSLEIAITKARHEYLYYLKTGIVASSDINPSKTSSTNESEEELSREEIGNLIFEKISPIYPSKASKLTGMFLQMNLNELKKTLQDKHLFEKKIKVAIETLNCS